MLRSRTRPPRGRRLGRADARRTCVVRTPTASSTTTSSLPGLLEIYVPLRMIANGADLLERRREPSSSIRCASVRPTSSSAARTSRKSASLLQSFSPRFARPSFESFVTLMSGWVLNLRRHTVTETVRAACAVGTKHISSFQGGMRERAIGVAEKVHRRWGERDVPSAGPALDGGGGRCPRGRRPADDEVPSPPRAARRRATRRTLGRLCGGSP